MKIIKYNVPKAGSMQIQYGGYAGGLTVTGSGGTGTSLTETHSIWGQPFNGTQDVSGDITGARNIFASGDLSLTGVADGDDETLGGGGILATGSAEFGSYVLSKSYMRAVKFYGDIEGDDALIGTVSAHQGNIENVQGTNLSYEEGYIGKFLSDEITSGNIVTDYLTVNKCAHFFELVIDKIKAAGGAAIFSPADGFTVQKVQEFSGYWMLMWLADDGTKQTDNMWERGDQAVCRSFNVSEGTSYNVSNKYYWALVVDTGTRETEDGLYNFIVLSKSDYDGVLNPEVGDEIAMLGNRGDASRQSAIYLAATSSLDPTLTPPLLCHYRGISDYNLGAHKYTWFAANGNTIRGDIRMESGATVQDFINETAADVYTHYAYANSADGSVSFSKKPFADYGYLGTAITGTASDVSLTYSDYTWVPVSNRRLKYEYSDDAYIRVLQTGEGKFYGSNAYVYLYIPDRGLSYTATVDVDVIDLDGNVTREGLHVFTVTRTYTGSSYTESCSPASYATGTAGKFVVPHTGSPYQKYSCTVKYHDVEYPLLRLHHDTSWNESGGTYAKPYGTFWFTSNGHSVAGSSRMMWFGSRDYDGTVTEVEGDSVDWQVTHINSHYGIKLTANANTPETGSARVHYTLNGTQAYQDINWAPAPNEEVYLTEETETWKLVPLIETATVNADGKLTMYLQYKVLHTVGNKTETQASGDFQVWLGRKYQAGYTTVDKNPTVTATSILWSQTDDSYRAVSNKVLGYYVWLIEPGGNTSKPLDTRYIPIHMTAGAVLEIDDSIRTWVQGNVDDLTDSYTTLEQSNTEFKATVTEQVEGLTSSVTTLQLTADGLTSSVERINSKNLLGYGQYFDSLTNATYEDGTYTVTGSGVLDHSGADNGVGDCVLSFYATRSDLSTTIKVQRYRSVCTVNLPGSPGVCQAYTSFTVLDSDSEEYFGRRAYVNVPTGDPGSTSHWYLKVTLSGSGTISDFLMVPDNATSSLISQTAEEILFQVGNTSVEIVPTEIVLNGNTRVEGSVAVNNGGFSLNGPDGTTQISPDGVGTYSSFASTTSATQTYSANGSTASGSTGTWSGSVTINVSVGTYPDGADLVFPEFTASGTWWHDNKGYTSSWNISKMALALYDGNTQLAGKMYNLSTPVSHVTRSNVFTGVTGTGNALKLKVTLTGSFSTTAWPSGAPSIIEGYVSIQVRQPLSSSLGLLGYNGYCSNYGDYNNVFLGPEGAYFQYGQNNSLRITPSGLQKYCGTTTSSTMETGAASDTATSYYMKEWTSLFSRACRTVNGSGSTYLQQNDEVIRIAAAAILYLPYPYKEPGREIMVANETVAAVTVNTKTGTVSIPANKCYRFVSSGSNWYYVALSK